MTLSRLQRHRPTPAALYPSHACTAIQGPFHHLHVALIYMPKNSGPGVELLKWMSGCSALHSYWHYLSFLTLSGVNSTFQLPKDILRFNWNNTYKTLRKGGGGQVQFWLQKTRLSTICLAHVNLPHHSHLPKSQGCWKDVGRVQGKAEMLGRGRVECRKLSGINWRNLS